MYYREFPTMFDWVHNGASIAIVFSHHTAPMNDLNSSRETALLIALLLA